MLKIIDKYIIKRYLLTILVMLLLFIPIGILIDLSEKVDKIIQRDATRMEIILYYLGFAGYFADLLIPIFLFISIIWFTSRMANNTEVIAILSAGVSFNRFLRPYFIGALVMSFFVFLMGMFIVPKASKIYQDFSYKYVYRDKVQETKRIFNQINDNEYVYVSEFRPKDKIGYNFSLEHFEGRKMTFKINAQRIKWQDSIYQLQDFKKRYISDRRDSIMRKTKLDTLLPFRIDELSQVAYIAETKNIFELSDFIEKERKRGSPNLNKYILVSYKRWWMSITVFILTLIAVSVSAIKRRGGMGSNLSFGMIVAFVYIFFDRIFSVLVSNSNFSPTLAVLIPNLIFGGFAFYTFRKARL